MNRSCAWGTILLGSLVLTSVGAQAGDWTIDYCKDLSSDRFTAAARWAFRNRGYQIEKDTPTSLIGALRGKKVAITMTTPGDILIRWVPGFGYNEDNWLKNVRFDVLWALAGEARTGALTINWCKDLSSDRFTAAARWAFRNRGYQIQKDTPTSLIGALEGKKVEITMATPGDIVIRWVPGFGYKKDNWLENLWRDVDVALEHYVSGREDTVSTGSSAGDALRALFAGSTSTSTTSSSKSGWMYTRSDNTILGRLSNGDTDEGTWRISQEGWFCRTWKSWADGKEGCWQVEPEEKKKYTLTPKAGVADPYVIKILQGRRALQYRRGH